MRVVSLFTGAGGMDLGFLQAGHQVVWANDNDPDAVRTYRHNIGDHIVEGDIESIPSKEIPDADIVIGGFPCQGFSLANLKRSVSDERNALYVQFLRILIEKRPAYFVAENVRGLLSLDGGSVISMILEDFRGAGFRVSLNLKNVADFGVPQSRWRVFIVGEKEEIPVGQQFRFPAPTHSGKADEELRPWVTIREALAGIPEPWESHELKNHVYSMYKVTNRNFTGHRRTNPEKPSPTILARGNGRGGVCAIQHWKNHRRLSVRESAIIQTFPIDFEFMGSMNSMYRQVGNAVPVLFARKLAEQFGRIEKGK